MLSIPKSQITSSPPISLKLFCSRNLLVLWLYSTDGWWRVRCSDFWTPWQRISGAAEGERGPPASGERTKQMGLHTNNAKHQTQPAKEPGRHRRWNATQKRSLLMRLRCSFCLRSSAPRPRHTVDSETSVYLIAVSGSCRKCKTELKEKAVMGLKHSVAEAWVEIRLERSFFCFLVLYQSHLCGCLHSAWFTEWKRKICRYLTQVYNATESVKNKVAFCHPITRLELFWNGMYNFFNISPKVHFLQWTLDPPWPLK